MKAKENYDVIIVGSGIVGAALALLLGRTALKILLIDSQTPSINWQSARYDLRVSAINRQTEAIFREIDIWPEVCARRISAFQHMRVWDQSIESGIHFSGTKINQPNLGYIVENNLLQKTLLEKIQQHANIEVIFPIQTKAIETQDNHVVLFTDQKTFKAKLLVGCDGAQSWVRQESGIEVSTEDCGQTALVCQIQMAKSHQQTAWQRFLATGPLAFLPLQDPTLCSIVWSAHHAYASHLQALAKEEFLQTLMHSVEGCFDKMIDCSDRITFPLNQLHAKNYVRSRIALVGDSAHKIHPLAGQGLNLGLADAYKLHEIILTTYSKKRDIGHLANLRQYERIQRPINQMMVMAMMTFNRVFSNQNAYLSTLRNAGLTACNQLTFLKNYFARKALGTHEMFYLY